MDQEQVAAALEECGYLLEIQGENPFRCQAYLTAARAIRQLSTSLTDLIQQNKLKEVPGIGATLHEKIITMVTTGRLPFLEDLRKKTPPGLLEMLRLPGIGPKKIKAMYDQLGIDTLDKLKAACAAGQVAKLKGFGDKTQQKILEGLAFIDQMGQRVRLDQALPVGLALLDALRQRKEVIRIELGGSLRRRKETIKDVDLLVSSVDPAPIMKYFVSLPQVVQVVAHGETKSSVVVAAEGIRINADLRVVTDEQFPFALHYFTGSKEHNIAMRARAITYGLKLNEYELAGAQRSIPCKTEADLFRALDLDYIPPELREDTGEIAAAEKHQLPKLIEVDQIQGVFHCHTTWSDGAASLEDMAHAAQKLGLKYLGIGDHSQSLTVANGLTPERVKQQQADIDVLNNKLTGIQLLKGIECDILPDGKLDYDDAVLDTFDYVVASVHSHFNQPEKEMTERIIKAIHHPRVTMLGHATGRLLMRRDAYKVDLEAVLKAAAQHGTMIEINAHPMRLDLDWIHCKRAKELGVQLVINPDAHATNEIVYYQYGVDVARRGWLEKKDVFNTQTLNQVMKHLTKRRK
ncbi:MAG: DNA polymerase/3'-5' exonuclease PolX [Gemmataceae bacterium]